MPFIRFGQAFGLGFVLYFLTYPAVNQYWRDYHINFFQERGKLKHYPRGDGTEWPAWT